MHVDKESLTAQLTRYLDQHQLKSTKQREIIIEALLELKDHHVSIDEVLAGARKINPNIGYATIYRTLMLLVEAGLVQQRHFSSGQSLFELSTGEHHDHLICNSCKRIFEFENDAIENLQERIAKKFCFKLTSHKMELYGTCRECQAKGQE